MKATITSKGQLTLPKMIRKKMNLHTGDKVEFVINRSGEVFLVAQKRNVLELKGLIKSPKSPVSLDEMEKAIMEEGGAL